MSDTFFAPAARATKEELERQVARAATEPLLEAIADSVSSRFLVLNGQRQIVNGNVPGIVPGKRHGEAFACIHAYDGPGGCGTSKACSLCGAAQAVVGSMEGRRQVVRECRMVVEPLAGRDYEVTATPFDIGGEPFTLVFFEPLAKEKPETVAQAEQGGLAAAVAETPVRDVLSGLDCEVEDSDAVVDVDPQLTAYALANLVEFGKAAGAVAVRYDASQEHRTFVVSTRHVIAPSPRLFDSGKLYAARLIGERVLGGRVWMAAAEDGTAQFFLGFGTRSKFSPS